MRRASRKLLTLLVCSLLAAAVAVIYWQTARYDFVNFDDGMYVYENRRVMEGLTSDSVAWAFTNVDVSNWHPLAWVSLMADVELVKMVYGASDRARLAAWMHLVNAALHGTNSVLLFLMLREATRRFWRSAFVAAVFAVHPMHVESVAWISERKDVLSVLLAILALMGYLRYARRPSFSRQLWPVAAFALGLMAKSMIVTLPIVFLLLDYWPLRRRLRPALVVEKWPYWVLALVSAGATIVAHRSTGALVSTANVGMWHRLGCAALVYLAYVGKSVWPSNLAALYPELRVRGPWPFVAAAILLVAATVVACRSASRGKPWLAVGWFWYLATLAPTIGVVQWGIQERADRFMYFPQIGLSIVLVWGVTGVFRHFRYRRLTYGAAAGVALVALASCSWRQTSFWRDGETLWARALSCTSRNFVAHYNYGIALAAGGKFDEAMSHYRTAFELQPVFPEAHNSLGMLLASLGHGDEAFAEFQRAVETGRNYAPRT